VKYPSGRLVAADHLPVGQCVGPLIKPLLMEVRQQLENNVAQVAPAGLRTAAQQILPGSSAGADHIASSPAAKPHSPSSGSISNNKTHQIKQQPSTPTKLEVALDGALAAHVVDHSENFGLRAMIRLEEIGSAGSGF
jgi:hypothetical protein